MYTIAVTVSGGLITGVYAEGAGPADIRAVVVDYDNKPGSGEPDEKWLADGGYTWGGYEEEVLQLEKDPELQALVDDALKPEEEEPEAGEALSAASDLQAEDLEGVPLPPIDTCPVCGDQALTVWCRASVRYAVNNCADMDGKPSQDWERVDVYDDEAIPDEVSCSDCGTVWERSEFVLNDRGFVTVLADKQPFLAPK